MAEALLYQNLTFINRVFLGFAVTLLCAMQPALADGGHGGTSVSRGFGSWVCASRDDALKALKKYGEERQGFGVTKGGEYAELYANPETGTWTWVFSKEPGTSCFLKLGDGWESISGLGT